MAFRNIVVSSDSHLSLEQNQLKVISGGNQISIPIEDIRSVIIENLQTTLSTSLLSKLTCNNVVVFFCDTSHLPVGLAMPFQQHSRQRKKIIEQNGWSLPYKKKIWKEIVWSKIDNQRKTLLLTDSSIDIVERLRYFCNILKSGDPDNCEGSSAQAYFPALFGKDFNRTEVNSINSGLNYGYAIVRGLIARAVVAYGYIPSLGIQHKNEFNNFNLVDDLIEPFRPFVDYHIKLSLSRKNVELLDKEDRQKILQILEMKVSIEGKSYNLATAIDKYVETFSQSSKKMDHKLVKFPKLLVK